MKNEKIIYIESPQIPLSEVPYEEVKSRLINPITGEKYKGVILEGIFADLNENPNRNNRIYDIPEYLKHLEDLKQRIHSDRGVYGECEHPSRYSVDFNEVSHKLLDVWYVPESKLVYGRLMLLNNAKGNHLRQVIESGGKLAVSARAAGETQEYPDGTVRAYVQLLVTYDIVYHPGFGNAVLDFKELNESYIGWNVKDNGFSLILYPDQLKNISESYATYMNFIGLSESEIIERRSKCFLHSLAEQQSSQKQEEKEQKILEDNQPVNKHEEEKELSASVQSLYESEKRYSSYFTKILKSIK